jgi:RimJ/RimL family protein N-acetyltransferase
MKSAIKDSKIHLRPAAPEDCDLVFGWRNLPEIVHLSSSRRQVSASEHREWYKSVLIDQNRPMFLIEESGSPVGLIRFEINNSNEAEISVYLIPGMTGRGIGALAILIGCDILSAKNCVKKIIAKIRYDNLISIKAFTKCGFRITRDKNIDINHVAMILEKPY